MTGSAKEARPLVRVHVPFDAGSVVHEIVGLLWVNFPADRLSDFDEVLEHFFKAIGVILADVGELGGVGGFVKSAEVAKFPAAAEYPEQQGVRGDSESFLDDESTDKAFQARFPLFFQGGTSFAIGYRGENEGGKM